MERRVSANGVVYYSSPLIPCPHGFSTRIGGYSTNKSTESLNLCIGRHDNDDIVIKNLEKFAKAISVDPHTVISVTQIHSDMIREVSKNNAGEGYYYHTVQPCDGYISVSEGITLGIKTADCVPILLYAKLPDENAVIAAVHAGWKGTLLSIVTQAVDQMIEKGANVNDIFVAIGPAIGQCCYEVSKEFYEAFLSRMGDAVDEFFIHSVNLGHLMADIVGINRFLLLNKGIPCKNIDVTAKCTCCHPKEFYSHRYSGEARGTMLALITLN